MHVSKKASSQFFCVRSPAKRGPGNGPPVGFGRPAGLHGGPTELRKQPEDLDVCKGRDTGSRGQPGLGTRPPFSWHICVRCVPSDCKRGSDGDSNECTVFPGPDSHGYNSPGSGDASNRRADPGWAPTAAGPPVRSRKGPDAAMSAGDSGKQMLSRLHPGPCICRRGVSGTAGARPGRCKPCRRRLRP